VKGGEEWMVGGQGQDPLFRHGALDVVVLNDHVLLQDLDGEDLKTKILVESFIISLQKQT
jgi:hypothetical protein